VLIRSRPCFRLAVVARVSIFGIAIPPSFFYSR
jgi:hypothetical protein